DWSSDVCSAELPLPPLCQVRFGVRFFVVIQAQPMRSPSSKSARGSAAPAPGALPSRTARSQMDMACVVERIAPVGADPPRVHGDDDRNEEVYQWLRQASVFGKHVLTIPISSYSTYNH